jgi:hypothetical protein
MLNLSLIVLQLVFPLCDYKVWIDTERGEEAKNHLRRMVELNLMEEEFCARRTAEHRRAIFMIAVQTQITSSIHDCSDSSN